MSEDDLKESRMTDEHIRQLHTLPHVNVLRDNGAIDNMYLILREDVDLDVQSTRRDEFQDRMNDHEIPPRLQSLQLGELEEIGAEELQENEDYGRRPLGQTFLEKFGQDHF